MANTSTSDTSTCTGNSIPRLSSDDLNIESWERMDHGGHSFVFKVSINGEVSVVKIFRFQTRVPPNARLRASSKPSAERPEPYIYYRRESTSYGLLCAANLTGSLTPQVHGTLCISPTHEADLLSEGKLKGLSKRREKDMIDRPLIAMWIEYIGGRRLAMRDILGERGSELKGEVESALQRIHDAGVVQGDVKWRNIMVFDNHEFKNAGIEKGRKIVWLDFSNAITRESTEKPLWHLRVDEEMQRLREMLGRHELLNSGSTEGLVPRSQVTLDNEREFVPERMAPANPSTTYSVYNIPTVAGTAQKGII